MAQGHDQGDKRAGENALMESCQVVLDKDATTLKVSFSSHLFSFYYSAFPSAYISSRMAFFGS